MKTRCISFKSRLAAASKFDSQFFSSNTSRKMTAAGAIFTQLQIRETHNKAKGRRFTMEEKLLSLSLYKHSKKSYRLLSKLFTLPSRKTLSSLLSKIPIKTGLDETFLKVLGENVKHLKKKDKFCVILFDEVSLEAQLHYNHNVGNIMGFEDNGFMTYPKFCRP